MKFVFSLIIILGLSFALFSDPPIANMTELNNAALSGLQNNYLAQLPKSSPTIINPIEAADAKLIKLDPSIDNFISADKIPKIIWVWAEKHADEVNQPGDLQKCVDGANLRFKSKTFSPVLTVSFRSVNKTIVNPNRFDVDIPFSNKELNMASAYDNISVSLSGQFNFAYYKTTLHYRYLPCSEQGSKGICVPSCDLYSIEDSIVNFSRKFYSSINYTVEGGKTLFFLLAPVLREQWYKNNKFNNLAFSNRVFYKARAKLNDEEIGMASIYTFDLSSDNLGIYYIRTFNLSNNNSIMLKESDGLFFPKPLEKQNDSFAYLYQINSTYSAIGKNNLSIVLFDRFLNSFEHDEEIASRALSAEGNKVESSDIIAEQDKVRPSLPYKQDNLSSAIIGIGSIAILVFIVLKKAV